MVRDMSNTMKGRPAESTQYFERIPGISYEITSRGVLSGNDINGLPITFSAFGKSFAGEITLHLKENSEHLTRVSGIEFNSGKEGKGVSGGGINASSGYEVRFYNEDNSVLSILLDKKQFDLLSNLYNQHIQAEFQKQVNKNPQLKAFNDLQISYDKMMSLFADPSKKAEYEKQKAEYEKARKEYKEKY